MAHTYINVTMFQRFGGIRERLRVFYDYVIRSSLQQKKYPKGVFDCCDPSRRRATLIHRRVVSAVLCAANDQRT